MTQQIHAIVLNMNNTGLGVTRSLGQHGIPVVGLDHSKTAVGFRSRYCKRRIIVNDPVLEPGHCLQKLFDFSENIQGKAVLLATSDLYVNFISRYRDELSSNFLFNIPDHQLLEQIVDKRKQYDLAKKFDLASSQSYYPENLEDIKSVYHQIQFPLFVKGSSSTLWMRTFRTKGYLVNNFPELEEILKRVFDHGLSPIVQEVILGPNKNHFKVSAYYDKNNDLKCIFSTQKTRQFPIDFGVGSFMISQYHEELIHTARRLFEGIGYTGVGSIEFKLDERDNKFKFIELNPRFWEQNIQATHAGINFPYANYLDCIGQKIPFQNSFRDNIAYINLFEDFKSYIYHRKSKYLSLDKWIRSLFRVNCHSYYAKKDILPVIQHLRNLLTFYLKRLSNKITMNTKRF